MSEAGGAGPQGDVGAFEPRRGTLTLWARADDGMPRGTIFVPLCLYTAAINKSTNAALDHFAKIREFKCGALRVQSGGLPPLTGSCGGSQLLAALQL